jgi:tRNA threonylcarbamoyladenosine biosynthesis protein TsaE
MQVTIDSLMELPDLASQILKNYSSKIILFYGDMGVGKTTFIRSLCAELGVKKTDVSSPTYSLINEYKTVMGDLVYHFDFYRLDSDEEAYDIGYEDYFYSEYYCFIEWPEKIFNLLPEKYLSIHIEALTNKRIFTIKEINS